MSGLSPVALGDKVWTFTANAAEIVTSDPRHELTGEIEDLGKVRAKCVDLRWTRRGALRVFRVVGGGECFQLRKLPRTIKPSKKEKS